MRQRTVDLVKQSIDALLKDKQRVSLATFAAKSKELDAESNGKGISESAILDNQEARMYYEQHRSWRGSSRKRAKPLTVAMPAFSLLERLIVVERTMVEQRERWLVQRDEALTWRLRAEIAEARSEPSDRKPSPSRRLWCMVEEPKQVCFS